MKNILKFILISVAFLTLFGCDKVNDDALKFKEEYEVMNGEKYNGNTIRKITIPKDNPFVYKSAEDIVKMIEDDETFLVYFGFSKCPWCRSVLPVAIDVFDDEDVSTVYYVDISDVRDTIEIVDGEAVTSKEGSSGYNELVLLLSDVLSDYVVDGTVVGKRIFAPNFVSVVKGEAKSVISGISERQTDAYMNLTDDILDDMEEKLENFVEQHIADASVCEVGQGC